MFQRHHGFLLIALAVLALSLLACGTASSGASSGPAQPTASTPPPTATPQPMATATPLPSVAYQLATLDTQSVPDAPVVAKYQTLLTSLHNKTGDSEQTISDDTVKAQQLLQQKGKSASLLDLLTGVDGAITKSDHMHYADAVAALITIMENQ